MTGIDDTYARKIHRDLNYYAAWTPETNFRLGDYGEFDGTIFKRIGNVSDDFNIAVQTEEFSDEEIAYSSEGVSNVNVTAEVDQQGRVTGNAKLDVAFDQANAIFFQATGVRTRKVQNMQQLGTKLIDIYKQRGRDWRLNMAVITELKTATDLVALISKKRNVAVKLRGKVKRGKAQNPTTLDLQDLSIEVQNSSVAHFTDGNGSTPLFRLHQVRDPLTSRPFFDTQP